MAKQVESRKQGSKPDHNGLTRSRVGTLNLADRKGVECLGADARACPQPATVTCHGGSEEVTAQENEDHDELQAIEHCEKLLNKAAAQHQQILAAVDQNAAQLAPTRVKQLTTTHKKRKSLHTRLSLSYI